MEYVPHPPAMVSALAGAWVGCPTHPENRENTKKFGTYGREYEQCHQVDHWHSYSYLARVLPTESVKQKNTRIWILELCPADPQPVLLDCWILLRRKMGGVGNVATTGP